MQGRSRGDQEKVTKQSGGPEISIAAPMREDRLGELEQAVGYRFRQPDLIERALTHRSAVTDADTTRPRADNEQLEYLGDAVLGMVVSEYLVCTFTHWSEGQLSKSRARLVNASSLCAAARRWA